MNLAAAIAFAAASLAIYVGTVAWRMSHAPGWRDQRWFALIAFCAAAYAIFNIATTLALPDRVVLWSSHIQLAACLVQVFAWNRYADIFLGRRPGPLEQPLVTGLLGLAALSLLPGLPYDGTLVLRSVPLLGTAYKDAVPTLAGTLLFAAGLGAALPVLLRLGLAWRRGAPHAGLHAASFFCIFLFGLNDALAAEGVVPMPYLLDIGFVIPVAAVAWSNTQRFVRDAEALHGLRGRLESLVEERTRALARSEAALHQSEKLAALGQFAAGVAHEVNNPASVVTANLRYLAEARPGEPPRPDAAETIDEALEAMQRINALVRKLVDAGRLAAGRATAGATQVLAVAEQVMAEGRARTGARVEHALRVPSFLQVGLPRDVLHQILAALAGNAAEAIPVERRGRVEVSAGPGEGSRVRIEVQDDGLGLTPEALRRAFEPFFTTKAEGRGSGLGLTVARALAESHGGSLRLEHLATGGTRALLEVPGASQGEVAPAPPVP
jgi:signal transduction histidine kinase